MQSQKFHLAAPDVLLSAVLTKTTLFFDRNFAAYSFPVVVFGLLRSSLCSAPSVPRTRTA